MLVPVHNEERGTVDSSAPSLRVSLLGGFLVECRGRIVPEEAWKRSSAKTLVKLLATERSHRLHREQVLELLWPEVAPDSAEIGLRKALHHARHALEPDLPPRGRASFLLLTNDVVALANAGLWVDADHFETCARKALQEGSEPAIEAALAAYGGDLLPGDPYEDWAEPRRAELAGLFIRLLIRLAAALEDRGAFGPAIDRLQQALHQDPAREEVHQRLMRLHVLSGSRHQALRQYQTCREVLRRELDVEPAHETEELYAAIVAGRLSPASTIHPAEDGRVKGPPLPPAATRLPSTPFMGRELALELLLAQLERAEAGRGGSVLLGGEAGVGKTRLATELARSAHGRGARVMWGAGQELEGLVRYGPFVDALEDYLGALSPANRTRIAADYPELAPLLPSVRIAENAPTSDHAERDRRQLFAAVALLLAGMADDRPLLLVLDDLHAADPESLQLFHHLARLAGEHRWLIVGTYREEDVAAESLFRRLAVKATRQGICRRVDLLRLSRHDCDLLARSLFEAGAVEEGLLDRLYAWSLGNPLFLQEIVEAMREWGEAVLFDGRRAASNVREITAPRQVRELVEARVDAMGEGVRRMLALASTAGSEFPFSELREAAKAAYGALLSDEALLDALDRALAGRILEEREDRYAFVHPLFRAALYERLSRPRRAHLHTALAQTIERRRPEDAESLAYHFARSEEPERAVEYEELAGDRAWAAYANDTAERYYRQAIDRADAADRPLVAARCRQKLGAALRAMARYDEALDTLTEAAKAYRAAGDTVSLGRTVAEMGRVHLYRGTLEDGIALTRSILEELEGARPPAALASLATVTAALLFMTGRYSAALEMAEQGAELARDIGDDWNLAGAETWRGSGLIMAGRVDEGMRILEETLPLAERVDHRIALAVALNNLSACYGNAGRLDMSVPYLERALELAERQGDMAQIAGLAAGLAGHLWTMGEQERARAHLRRAQEALRESQSTSVAPFVLLAAAAQAFDEGDWETAAQQLEEVGTVTGGGSNLYCHAQARLAHLDLVQGRPEAGLVRVRCLLDRPDVGDVSRSYVLALIAWSHLDLGDPGRAEEVAREAVAAACSGVAIDVPFALRILARVLRRLGRMAEAEEALAEAVAQARSVLMPYEEAQALLEWGLLEAARGKSVDARLRLAEAGGIFRRLGARKDVERVDAALAAHA